MVRTVIVEDDPMVMEVNRQYIENVDGFQIVGTAETGAEAIEIVKKIKPQLVILDIFLPDKDGLETLREIRQSNLPTDVILVTAVRDAETIRQVFRLGAVDYIVKPFKFERIKSALEAYKALLNKLNKKESLSQEDIDQITTLKTQELSEELPKGLTEVTMKQVILYLFKQNESLSAEEVAEGIGLARVTARRYLDYLEKTGKVKLEVQYGSVGRPINRYRNNA
ncbi:response regulator [Metallumcola ferriviriculae]|uniref:Transcriptional regulatory protein n=1 Tax=Metallumcola ferriviriculae TaxID=3039180 RepID=A0AAU0UJQ6_9FIRM|nr:response regulator [Desulfitibacteraceae bacterium MK1]